MTKSIAEKLLIQPDMRAFLKGIPSDIVPDLVASGLKPVAEFRGTFNHIHLFVTSRAQLEHQWPQLKSGLAPDGQIWISWPKAKKFGTDLTLREVIEVGYGFGLVESKCISINDVWSALRFTWPKPGVTYNNSYGTLSLEL